MWSDLQIPIKLFWEGACWQRDINKNNKSAKHFDFVISATRFIYFYFWPPQKLKQKQHGTQHVLFLGWDWRKVQEKAYCWGGFCGHKTQSRCRYFWALEKTSCPGLFMCLHKTGNCRALCISPFFNPEGIFFGLNLKCCPT